MYCYDCDEEYGRRMSNLVPKELHVDQEGRKRMKRSVVALGILGLVYALLLPGASAQTTLLKDDFSTDALLKSSATYVQGLGDTQRSDPTVPPFFIRRGILTSSPTDDGTPGSDGVSNADADPPSVRFLLLTGDKSWSDVSMQAKARSEVQNTGVIEFIVRAAPKTKPSDPDSWYEFRYTTGTTSTVTPDEDKSGITVPEAEPNLRIMKVVNGKWTMLAETDGDRSAIHIPAVNAAGDDNATGAIFRFVAKGNLLQAFIGLPGKPLEKILEAKDDELKAGVVGFDHYEYNPQFDDLLVEDAP
jgi:hypothetical protein